MARADDCVPMLPVTVRHLKPAQKQEMDLPPIPAHVDEATARQMREYARLAVLAERARIVESLRRP
jgi:hypothetical protein